jgi:hypothetical protein
MLPAVQVCEEELSLRVQFRFHYPKLDCFVERVDDERKAYCGQQRDFVVALHFCSLDVCLYLCDCRKHTDDRKTNYILIKKYY